MALCLLSLVNNRKSIQSILISFISFLIVLPLSAEENVSWLYTVRPGDNLITIAKTHLINPDNWKLIQTLNHIKNPYQVPVGLALKIPLEYIKQGPASAEVILVSGQAQVQQSATNFIPLVVGQTLGAGANIMTKENSKVVIKLADDTVVEIASNTNLRLDTLSLYSGGAMVDTKLRLQNGQVKTEANPKHIEGNKIQIITPSAIAAVRGTSFRVSEADHATTQETLDGKVALIAMNDAVFVDKGFGSKAENGKPPIKPTPLLPKINTDNMQTYFEAVPIRFVLPKMQGAESWVGSIATDDSFNTIVAESEVKTDTLVFNDMPDGQYFLNVRAKDQHGIAGYDALHAFTINARPLQPIFIAPADGMLIRDAQPLFKWDAVIDAKSYIIEIATDPSFEHLFSQHKLNETSWKMDKKLEIGQYFWRIKSVSEMNGILDKGPALKFSQFDYKPLPAMPDVSQLEVKVQGNRVFVKTIPSPQGMVYSARVDNPFNQQETVWQGSGLTGEFNFLLKEYGKQILYLRHLDSDGSESPAAIYEFDAQPE